MWAMNHGPLSVREIYFGIQLLFVSTENSVESVRLLEWGLGDLSMVETFYDFKILGLKFKNISN